jgi:RHS repeat-associated protein
VGASRLPNSPTSPPGIATSGHAVLFDPVTNLPQDLNELVDEVMSPGWVLHVAVRKAGDYIYGTGTLDGVVRAYRMTLSSGIVIDPTFGALTATNGMTMSGNAYGDAVGTGRSEPNGPLKAWVYVEGIGLKILNDIVLSNSGWTLDSANAINDAGDVVGVGTHGGIRKPFRLRLPIRANGATGPMLAEVHTYGFDGLRTSTTTFSPSNMMVPPKSQYWFTQDYTEREGKREHYVRIGDRIVAKVTMVPAPGGSGFVPVMDLRSKKLESGGGSGEPRTGLGVLLLALGLLGAAVASLKKRRGWVPSVAAVMALIFTATSCAMFGGDKVKSALWGPGTADDAPLYFHQGIAPGPTIITKSDGTVFEERRYEPFGHPIDARRGGTQVSAVSFAADPQNILGKMTNPNTGWSYHGARWMAPQTARWSTPDPAVKGPRMSQTYMPWDLNPYSYVRQGPTMYWDPNGTNAVVLADVIPGIATHQKINEKAFKHELSSHVRGIIDSASEDEDSFKNQGTSPDAVAKHNMKNKWQTDEEAVANNAALIERRLDKAASLILAGKFDEAWEEFGRATHNTQDGTAKAHGSGNHRSVWKGLKGIGELILAFLHVMTDLFWEKMDDDNNKQAVTNSQAAMRKLEEKVISAPPVNGSKDANFWLLQRAKMYGEDAGP